VRIPRSGFDERVDLGDRRATLSTLPVQLPSPARAQGEDRERQGQIDGAEHDEAEGGRRDEQRLDPSEAQGELVGRGELLPLRSSLRALCSRSS